MEAKIIKAIHNFYLSRFDDYEMSPEEIAKLVCKVFKENLPAEDTRWAFWDGSREHRNGWNRCLKTIKEML